MNKYEIKELQTLHRAGAVIFLHHVPNWTTGWNKVVRISDGDNENETLAYIEGGHDYAVLQSVYPEEVFVAFWHTNGTGSFTISLNKDKDSIKGQNHDQK
ncbi:MAG: hypothetical protein KGL39_00795 [Patescibacteria group bacterium]|nr:hypothetical protein [Patescibacteria group bacterium]